MSETSGFDRHPHVKYHDLTHLYWSVFPYKVVCATAKSASAYKTHRAFMEAKSRIQRQLVEPDPVNVWFFRTTGGNGINHFFKEESDALAFIDTNVALVTEVHRPRRAQDVTVMAADNKVRVRPTLYYGRYHWCVTLATQTMREDGAVDACDEWVEEYFTLSRTQEPDVRVFYSYSGTRKLYLRDEADVIAAKIALSEHVRGVERCVLQSEIDTNVPS